ncbi:hypothetical protein [Winogradskyella pulchriflava]|uniref:hypothetical protein n=1 Tax=Winogradskyella pulchriflava TaxID=1110688 RepID=UPI0036DC7F28
MIKKTIHSILFFCILDLVLFSCCESVYDVKISSVYFAVNDKNDFDLESINHNDLELFLHFDYEDDFAYSSSKIKPLNTAYATTCNDKVNVANRVTAITITANNEFNGIAAAESLNIFFKLKQNNDLLDVEHILAYINNDKFDADDSYELVLSEEIEEEVFVEFKISILLEDSQVIERNFLEVLITI